MRIAKLSCSNIKGFDNFSIECSDVNVCAGLNGTNKTSTLTLVTALFGNLGGKTNPRILRAGAERGEISAVIVNDDATETWEVSRVFLPGKVETPKVTSSVTGKVGSAVEFLKPLVDKVSIEPISRAMNADEDEQVKILLEAIPMAISVEDVSAAVGVVDVPGLKAHVQNSARLPSGLDAIAAVHKAIYDHRRDVNRDAKTKGVHAAELLGSIPESAAEDINWTMRVSALTTEKTFKAQAEIDERSQSDGVFNARNAEIAAQLGIAEQKLNEEFERKMRELEEERAGHRAQIYAATQGEYNAASDAHTKRAEAIQERYRPEREKIAEDLAVATQNQLASAGHSKTREIAQQNIKESEVLIAKSEAMTAALDRMDALKLQLLGKLDAEIKGLRVEGGVISMNGVALSELNTAERAKFWIRVGVMRAGELGVVACDGLECLDDFEFAKVTKAMLGTGLQFFLGRVDSKPFRVEVISA